MSTTTPPRVLLADDHTLVLEGFRRIVEQRCEVVGAVEDGRALLEAAVRLRPDLILLDISMPLLNGVDAGRQIKKLLPDVKLIFVTMHADPAYVSEAFKAGASAYLLKRSAARELDQAIEAVLKGQYFVTSLLTREIVTGLSSEEGGMFSQRQDLTPRQREVLQLIAEGRTIKEIAALLNISPKTVEFHKAQIIFHLNLRTTAELTKYALAHGLTSA
ncbi:MAG TPA: response regulator transcription factor [Nitrospira sp.]|jgi:DNA-binding NarL/FixJ family response regulator|nr:response regulator transcription factor [Nitrospira sp.]MBS0178277.1 response regulator transcription factor [Nitrospira sp.]MCC7472479.1 response regulator transcription factor [Candidatus Nomurabacteria bacterium]HNI67767.1 response regulator transcription factor [Nitrospira sp.]HNK14701.1 response regulator transcription factor [Nitrospira sp.]